MAGETYRLRMSDSKLEALLSSPEAGKALLGGILTQGGCRLSGYRLELSIQGEAILDLSITEEPSPVDQKSDMPSRHCL